MRRQRTHIIILTVIQIVALVYSHADLYVFAGTFAPPADNCACRVCICDDGSETPASCQITSAGCSHTNVQTLITFMKNAGPLPVVDAMVLAPANPPYLLPSSEIPVSIPCSGVFHPPRG